MEEEDGEGEGGGGGGGGEESVVNSSQTCKYVYMFFSPSSSSPAAKAGMKYEQGVK